MRKRNPKDAQLAEAIAPTATGDYTKFWELVSNRELKEFVMGKQGFEDAMVVCFPDMQRDKALHYCNALIELLR